MKKLIYLVIFISFSYTKLFLNLEKIAFRIKKTSKKKKLLIATTTRGGCSSAACSRLASMTYLVGKKTGDIAEGETHRGLEAASESEQLLRVQCGKVTLPIQTPQGGFQTVRVGW